MNRRETKVTTESTLPVNIMASCLNLDGWPVLKRLSRILLVTGIWGSQAPYLIGSIYILGDSRRSWNWIVKNFSYKSASWVLLRNSSSSLSQSNNIGAQKYFLATSSYTPLVSWSNKKDSNFLWSTSRKENLPYRRVKVLLVFKNEPSPTLLHFLDSNSAL